MRIDKYDPKDGGFRAVLAADWDDADLETGVGVGLDVNGRVVPGAGNTGIVGLLVLTAPSRRAGDVVDVMTHGECVEAGLDPGTVYYADAATGALGTAGPAAGANAFRVGHTVEGDRLVVRGQITQG